MTVITVDEAIAIVEQVIEPRQLSKVQALVFRQAWEGKSYLEIAKASGYDPGYIKDTGSKLWQILSEAYGVRISKLNVKGVLQRHFRQIGKQESAPTNPQPCSDWGEAVD